MPGLQLSKNNDNFVLDPLGTVTINNAPSGTWKTDQTNKIVVTKKDNTTVSFDVTWEFNTDNQLVVSAAGKKFNFSEVPGNVPRYETRDAVLVVRPNKNQPFTFELRGDWSLSENHDLTITINGKASTIDGFINDPRSRFMFHFSNKKALLQSSVLGFVGTWSEFVDADGQPRLKFAYKRDGQPDGEFVLPKGITIDKTMNQLMYEYDKNGNKRRIQLVGTLMISDDFTISYGLDRQTSADGQTQVGTTTFTFNAAFKKNNFKGDLDLAIVKQDGTVGSTTISISGKFTAVMGSTSLLAGFTFEQNRAGNKKTTTFGFSGKLQFNNNKGSIEWAFTTDNTTTKTITLAINVDITVGAVQLDARLNLQMEGGQTKGVTFFLGVGF
ncbi:MAG TPA: hypothetical protein VJM50_18080 [Pyrinomonadaceae bacterium]|nr:hypothetical protein [Pyrinomonadaceae bacterium]